MIAIDQAQELEQLMGAVKAQLAALYGGAAVRTYLSFHIFAPRDVFDGADAPVEDTTTGFHRKQLVHAGGDNIWMFTEKPNAD